MSLHLDASRRSRRDARSAVPGGPADGVRGGTAADGPTGAAPAPATAPSTTPRTATETATTDTATTAAGETSRTRSGARRASGPATGPGRRAVVRAALVLGGTALAATAVARTAAQDGSAATTPSAADPTTSVPDPVATSPDPAATAGAALGALLWSDEFDGPAGSGIDLDRWTPQLGAGGWGNGELQSYTDDPANLGLDGAGNLRITMLAQESTDDRGNAAAFTSARLQTVDATDVGRLEARIRVPAGGGLWAAFWTLGADHAEVGWPGSGEIDVMETYDSATEAESVVHAAGDAGDGTNRWRSMATAAADGSLADDFHVYAVDVTSDELSFSLDGAVYHVVRRSERSGGEQWPFDQPQRVLLNLAMSRWMRADSPPALPASLLVDYVRVYARPA